MSEIYTEDNLLDRVSDPGTLARQYQREMARERLLVDRRLGMAGGDVLSVGAGWHPGRHLFPKPAWRLVAVDPDPNRPKIAVERGEADDGFPGVAGGVDRPAGGSLGGVLFPLPPPP